MIRYSNLYLENKLILNKILNQVKKNIKKIIDKLKSYKVEVLEDLTQCITLEKNLILNKKIRMKNAEKFFKNSIYLPINPFLKKKEIKFISNLIISAVCE